MRLRLTVERHLLPSVRLLWNVSPSTAPGAGLTVSQFLDQVNDIVQLEADEWGLEDYAVEVQGFECLHFSEIHRLLKDDDEVYIRPLQTPDLRARKISGRHQITEDGRHLVDGVAFGRALLRKPSRPPIHIPPRKRRRLLANDTEEDSLLTQSLDQQVALRTQSDDLLDTNYEEDPVYSDEEEDSDYLDEDELGDEVQDIHDDQAKALMKASQRHVKAQRVDSGRNAEQGLGLILNADGTPYDGLDDDEDSTLLRPVKQRLLTAREASGNLSNTNKQDASTRAAGGRRTSSGSNKSVRFEDAELGTPATIRLSQDSDQEDSDDDDFQPDDSDESNKENAPPSSDSDDSVSDDDSEDDTDSSSLSSSYIGLSAEDETSSSGSSSTSSSGTDSESEPEETTSKKKPNTGDTIDPPSSTSSSSGSSSDSEDEDDARMPHVSPTTSVDDVQMKPTIPLQTNKPDGTGLKATRARNNRRRDRNLLNNLVKNGRIPAGSSVADALRWREERKGGKKSESTQSETGPAIIEARRQALLKSIEAGGVDVEQDVHGPNAFSQNSNDESILANGIESSTGVNTIPDSQEKRDELVLQRTEHSPVIQVKDSLEQVDHAADETLQHAPETFVPSAEEMKATEVPRASPGESPKAHGSAKSEKQASGGSTRRSKLDLAGSKRLLFGSLGLRTPKTKEDEIKLQEKLMSNVKPLKQASSPVDEVQAVSDSNAVEPKDESWRDKINLSAVECWDYDVVLSEPPFPFVQRWDPQYQDTGRGRKRKQKKRKRNDTSYYENQYDDSFNDSAANKSPRRENYAPITAEAQFDKVEGAANVQAASKQASSEQLQQDAQAASQQLIQETVSSTTEAKQPEEVDDLPLLPADTSTCEALDRDQCKEGAVVAFKKFEMELANEWHPYISDYRTARIEALHENGVVDMTYAKRDIPADHRHYDETTGERILGKLEMPGYDSDSEDADPSKVSIDFAELIEPLLIRPAGDVTHVAEEQKEVQEQEEKTNSGQEDPQAAPVTEAQNEDKPRSPSPVIDQSNKDQPEDPQNSQSSSADLEYHDAEAREEVAQDASVIDEMAPGSQVAESVVKDSQPQAVPNTQTREDMSQMFRDAGWRSSIGPDIRRQLQLEQQETGRATSEIDNLFNHDTPGSPVFHGFSSPVHGQDEAPPCAQPETNSTDHVDGQVPDSPAREEPTADSALLRTEHSIEYPALPEVDDDTFFPSQRSPSPPSHQPSQQSIPPISPPALRRRASSPAKTGLPSQLDGQSEIVNSIGQQIPTTFLSDASISSEEFPELFSQSFEKRLSEQPMPIPSPLSKNKKLSSSPKRTSTVKSAKTKVKRERTTSLSPISSTAPPAAVSVKKETKTSRARKLFTRPSFTSLRPSSSQSNIEKRSTNSNSSTTSSLLGAVSGKKSRKSTQLPAAAAASQVTIDEEHGDGFDDSFWPRFTQSQPVRGSDSQRKRVTPALTQESEIVDLTLSSDGAVREGETDDVGTYESLPSGSGWVSKKEKEKKGKKVGRSFP